MSPENTTKAGIFLNHRFGRWTVVRVTLALLVVLFFSTNQTLGAQPFSDAPLDGASGGTSNSISLVNSLFAALQSDDSTFPPAVEALLADGNPISKEDPNWPTIKYLLGEAYLRQNNTEQARAVFRELTIWAVSNDSAGPYGDRWGGSGLATIGLWRWLQILDENGPSNPNEIDQVLEFAEQLQNTRLFLGMVAARFLPALPLIEESVAERLAHVAWTHKRPEAAALFLNFLSIDSTGKSDEVDETMRKDLTAKSSWNTDRLDLFRARRILNLVQTKQQKDKAAEILKTLWGKHQAPKDVRAEAGYQWANYKRRQRDKQELITVLTEVIELAGRRPVAQKALFRRGLIYNKRHSREPLSEKKIESFREDMLELVHRFPRGILHDNALYQLAKHYFFKTNTDLALSYFERLRNLKISNDFKDSAYYLAVLALVGRGLETDYKTADGLLKEYVERYPDGVFRSRSLFWRGRIAEYKNDTANAGKFFQQVINEVPYNYYALRARMHLEHGAVAVNKDLPGIDSQTQRDLHTSYSQSQVDVNLIATSPYHERVRMAVDSGLYQKLLSINYGLEKRVNHIPLNQLNKIPATVLLFALRQDALAAKDSDLLADNLLRLAGVLSRNAGDWPTAIAMTSLSSNGPHQRRTDLQTDKRYLATVYPGLADLTNIAHPLAQAAWVIDGSKQLSQSLMYSVIRQESGFYSKAISKRGALGLFQFMPSTFRGLVQKYEWNLLKEAGVSTDVEYLLNADHNVALWARWVNKEFPLNHRNGIAMALMKHQAGSGNVKNWNHYWEKVNAGEDLEYKIETTPYNATGIFVRRVLRDTAIVNAAGLFAEQPGDTHE